MSGDSAPDVEARPFFTFRFQDIGEVAEDIGPATERAEATARAWLVERGYGFKNLTIQADDLSDRPLGKRGRRAEASHRSDR